MFIARLYDQHISQSYYYLGTRTQQFSFECALCEKITFE